MFFIIINNQNLSCLKLEVENCKLLHNYQICSSFHKILLQSKEIQVKLRHRREFKYY